MKYARLWRENGRWCAQTGDGQRVELSTEEGQREFTRYLRGPSWLTRMRSWLRRR